MDRRTKANKKIWRRLSKVYEGRAHVLFKKGVCGNIIKDSKFMKTAVVTGGTDGIGLETALRLAENGYQVILTGRDSNKCEHASEKIKSQISGAKIWNLCADFTDRMQIENAATFLNNYIQKIDILVNNAGTFETNYSVVEGIYERTFFVNHLAPFYFTYLILNLLDCSTSPRIINVSSMAHASELPLTNINSESHFDSYKAYSWSKLANILFTFKLAKLLEGKSITVNCLHPGVINTKLLKAGWGAGGDSVVSGAQTSLYLAMSEEVKNISGKYFDNKKVKNPAAIASDVKVQDALWEYSEKVFGICYADKIK